uniref:(northern house mosquito) hypothetical protein n=1 Tax=Culex pipiens TaxID=7175 RepID=A0A8D8PBV7_CULPI
MPRKGTKRHPAGHRRRGRVLRPNRATSPHQDRPVQQQGFKFHHGSAQAHAEQRRRPRSALSALGRGAALSGDVPGRARPQAANPAAAVQGAVHHHGARPALGRRNSHHQAPRQGHAARLGVESGGTEPRLPQDQGVQQCGRSGAVTGTSVLA